MKILLISSLLVVAISGGPVIEEDFQAIVDAVNSAGAKWKADISFVEGRSLSSLRRLLGVKREPHFMLPKGPKISIPDSAIPEQFDARDNWPQCPSIKHIRDQGNCGSCWAVASAGAFTDRLCIATNGSFTAPLSAEELMCCCSACGFGCQGGDPYAAWEFFKENGLVTGGDYQSNEGCQPYEIIACEHHTTGKLPSCDSFPEQDTPRCERKCTNPSYEKSFASDHHKVKSAYTVDGVKAIQKEIIANGPVGAAFNVFNDFLTYKSGVYQHTTGGFAGGHAVKIIGWGVEDDTPYWLVANQWRESWGDNGLFKILRGQNECGIEEEITAGIPDV